MQTNLASQGEDRTPLGGGESKLEGLTLPGLILGPRVHDCEATHN